MTKEEGKVQVEVPVPLLGTVSGIRTLADIVARKAQTHPSADEPAVVSTPRE